MGERLNGIQEVVGSIPIISTSGESPQTICALRFSGCVSFWHANRQVIIRAFLVRLSLAVFYFISRFISYFNYQLLLTPLDNFIQIRYTNSGRCSGTLVRKVIRAHMANIYQDLRRELLSSFFEGGNFKTLRSFFFLNCFKN